MKYKFNIKYYKNMLEELCKNNKNNLINLNIVSTHHDYYRYIIESVLGYFDNVSDKFSLKSDNIDNIILNLISDEYYELYKRNGINCSIKDEILNSNIIIEGLEQKIMKDTVHINNTYEGKSICGKVNIKYKLYQICDENKLFIELAK